MNRIPFLLGFMLAASLLSISCRKYAEGPGVDLRSTKKMIQGTWKINSYILKGKDYKVSLDSLYGNVGKLVITELLKKKEYQIELVWNNCAIQTLRPCQISKSENISIAEGNPKYYNKNKTIRQIECDYRADYVEIGPCFQESLGYLLLPKIYDTKYINNGNYGGTLEILKLNKKELKLSWKRSRPPFEKEIVVMELSKQ
jgi:hypothetical protein